MYADVPVTYSEFLLTLSSLPYSTFTVRQARSSMDYNMLARTMYRTYCHYYLHYFAVLLYTLISSLNVTLNSFLGVFIEKVTRNMKVYLHRVRCQSYRKGVRSNLIPSGAMSDVQSFSGVL